MKSAVDNCETLTLVGNCYANMGMSQHLREAYRAFRKVGRAASIYDLYGWTPTRELKEELAPALVTSLPEGIRLFHINGDEVQQAVAGMATRQPESFARGYNIIFPLWELPNYPAVWARELERFDEVWAPSIFIHRSLSDAVQIPVHHMPLACEPRVTRDFTRRYFGVPEARFLILFFWDASSYTSRKNPRAVVEVFRRIVAERPLAPVHLVLKVNTRGRDPEGLQQLKSELSTIDDRVTFIEREMTGDEIKNLVRCADCFMSLHRAEGFGFGLAEAMYFGVPVIGTAWSGNMDFMTADTALLVDAELVPVQAGEYPHWAGQCWAEPNLNQAKEHLFLLLDNPTLAAAVGRAAGTHMRKHFSHRAQGVRYLTRIEEIERLLKPSPLAGATGSVRLTDSKRAGAASGLDQIASEADDRASRGAAVNEILRCLRRLSLADFGELLVGMPNLRYPALSKVLPRMASADVQRAWTGADGLHLLPETLSFTTVLTNRYRSRTAKELSAARVLDFGCGYGRIMRAMYYFCDPVQLCGCDPWTDSLEHCRKDGMLGHFALSDYLPDRLPFEGKFDLLYAYSVLTHTSARATKQCLDVLAAACTQEAMVAITIRPVEYWNADTGTPLEDRRRCAARHRKEGFAFHPHLREPIDGDLVYGDTSMSLAWLADQCPQLRIIATEPVPTDPLQIIVYLALRH